MLLINDKMDGNNDDNNSNNNTSSYFLCKVRFYWEEGYMKMKK